jgi:hypothetical protein
MRNTDARRFGDIFFEAGFRNAVIAAAGDQISPDVVQPDGLAERSQLFERIVYHVLIALFSSSATLDRRRRRRSAPLNRAARNILTNFQASG